MRNNNTLPPPVVPLANLPSNATADPFAPVGFTASQSQSEVNFANFDNNPVFANSSFDSDKQGFLFCSRDCLAGRQWYSWQWTACEPIAELQSSQVSVGYRFNSEPVSSFGPDGPPVRGMASQPPVRLKPQPPTRPTSSGPSGRWCFELGSAHLWPGAWKDLLWYYYGEKSSPPEAQ
ncbi:unnamed protein product [Nesidiocoris tenuis]|uniref:Uncharacterized protein n=1 Tax=Nesidiocoris tenuis TaxID=355587 RepID=A0A6H5GUY8_9HEMI|nr:unnamed protein product [Nesidiocoris tenuis]